MRILREETAALCIDIQERLFPHIDGHEILQHNTRILLQGLQALDIPLLVTEQYRKGLGATIAPVQEIIPHFQPIEKLAFSCCGSDDFNAELKATGKLNVIVFGIETHVCVLQTALDLLEHGYRPVIVSDCVSSRRPSDKTVALERMRGAGCTITSYESILFELCRVAGTATFKTISRLVK